MILMDRISMLWAPRATLAALIAATLLLSACGGEEQPPTPTPAPALAPTFTPTAVIAPPADAAAQPPVEPAPVEPTQAPSEPTPAPSAPAAVAAPQVEAPADLAALLAEGRQLHRYGDYAAARAVFNRVAGDATATAEQRAEALYDLGRAYLGEGLYGEALATFDRLEQVVAGADPGQFAAKEQFLRGDALVGTGRYADAIAAYWRFLDAYPWMSEAVQPRIAEAYLALGDPASAATALRRAADGAGDSVAKAGLLERLARAQVAAGDYAAAVAAYDEILGFAQNAAYRSQVQYQTGQTLAVAGDGPGAVARWQAATAEAPEARAAYLALVELVNREVDFDLYQRGYIDIMAGAYEPAIAAFQAYLDSVAPTDARAGSALHRLGQSYLGAEQYAEAIATLDRVFIEHPACDCIGQAYLHKALAQASAGDAAGARRTYRTFAREFPDDPLAAEALWQSGSRALGDGNQLEAAADFMALADAFPASEFAPRALYALGVGALVNQLYGQASQALTRLQVNYPDYRPDAVAYWLGRSLAAEGKSAEARAQWEALAARTPDIYFGVLAAYALAGAPMTDAAMLNQIDAVAGPASRLAGDDGSRAFAESWLAGKLAEKGMTAPADLAALPMAVAENQDLAKGRLLLELDARGDALTALERAYNAHRDDLAALYPLSLEFARIGAYRLSLLSAVRLLILSGAPLVEDGPIFIQRLAYPQPFGDLITREARANDIDPRVYFSLIRQESLFEEGARSSAAAQGLAQIIPDTGRWVAERLGHPEYTNDIIYRPVINLRFGAYYLDWARDYLDGNLVSGLVGYNAGPGNSQAWRERAGADDTIFAETLTFSEPRVYIQQILANTYHYARLYD
jgi:soluble lytic murein transglycosylase